MFKIKGKIGDQAIDLVIEMDAQATIGAYIALGEYAVKNKAKIQKMVQAIGEALGA